MNHDVLCPSNGISVAFGGQPLGCLCEVIRLLREQIADSIESHRYKVEHGDACPCQQCDANEWLAFAARVARRDADFVDWEAKVRGP